MSRGFAPKMYPGRAHSSLHCACGESIAGGFTLSMADFTNADLGPRTFTVYLCAGCGTVLFDSLVERGVLSGANTKFVKPMEPR